MTATPSRTARPPSLGDIEEARTRLEGIARVTPVYSSETLGRLAGRPVFLKAENLQRTGSFKIRGAVNKIATLTAPEREAGVVAASAGNHGQAVAWAAREAGIAATIFMPQDAPMAKVDATRSYGAEVVLVGEGFEAAHEACRERVVAGSTLVHAFEDGTVIAGQGTLGLELADAPELAGVAVV
ncbi:MAG: pyridoxal-phosphate dependent enzyme, partial [Thermoleophilia bacterium]|nr:pyridoxal-phosphate dependent enzyme [Thermoleophilia bacterium]